MRRRTYLGAVGAGIGVAGCLGGRRQRSNQQTTTAEQDQPPAWTYTDIVDRVRAITIVDGTFIVVDSGDNVHAIDPSTGVRRWYVEPPSAPRRLAVSGRHVLVVTADPADLTAYRIDDGSRDWQVALDNFERAAYALWTVNGTVYAGGRVRNGYLDPEGYNTVVTAYGEASGTRSWERSYRLERGNWRVAVHPNGEFLFVGREPVLGASRTDGRANITGKLVKCSANGSISWSHPTENWLAAQLPTDAPDGEWVIAALDEDAENGGLVAYAADGTERWRRFYPGGPKDHYWGVAHRPVVTDADVLAVLAAGWDRDLPGRLCRFDRGTGERTDAVDLPESIPTGHRPALFDGRLYLAGSDALWAYRLPEFSVGETYAVPDGGQLPGLPAAWKLTRPVVDPGSRILALGVSDTLAGYEIAR